MWHIEVAFYIDNKQTLSNWVVRFFNLSTELKSDIQESLEYDNQDFFLLLIESTLCIYYSSLN